MGKGYEPWSCVRALPGGSALAQHRYLFGGPSRAIPQGNDPKALFSPDQTQPAEALVRDFMKRWSLEATFEESRAH
jgi:hypothetical protein